MRIACFSGSSMTCAAVLQSNKFRETSMAKAHKKVQARRKSASRKPAGSKATARRPAKAKTKARTKPRPKHKFTVSHHREQDFDQGLRSYAKYRDLGIAPATGGMVQARSRDRGIWRK